MNRSAGYLPTFHPSPCHGAILFFVLCLVIGWIFTATIAWAQTGLGLDELLDAEINDSQSNEWDITREAVTTQIYLNIVQHRLEKIQWQKRGNIFSLRLGKAFGKTDMDLTGSQFSSGSRETLQSILKNSYRYQEEQKLDALYWSRCSSKVDRLLRTISGYFFNQETAYHHQRSGNRKAYERYLKYHSDAKEKQPVNRDLEAMKKGCRPDMIKPVLMFIRDVNQFSQKAFQERQAKQEPVFLALDAKRKHWTDQWQRRHTTIQAEIPALIDRLQKRHASQFKTWQPQTAGADLPVSSAKQPASNRKGKKCFLLVTESGNYSEQAITDFAIPLISRFVALVHPVPLFGVKPDDCVYRISILETRQTISAAIGSTDFNTTGETKETGLEGVKAALVNAIVRAKPAEQTTVCEAYQSIEASVCGRTNDRKKQRLYADSPLVAVLDHFQIYPKVTLFNTINNDSQYRLVTRSTREKTAFFEQDKQAFFPGKSKVIFYHPQRHLISFREQSGPAQSIHFIMGHQVNAALEHGGFKRDHTPEHYARLFEAYGLVGFRLEYMFYDRDKSNYFAFVSFTARTPHEPALNVLVKFRKKWHKLEPSLKPLMKKETFQLEETRLIPDEIIFY